MIARATGPAMPLPPFPSAAERSAAVCGIRLPPTPPPAPDPSLTAGERAICARVGITERQFAAGKARLARLQGRQ